MAINQISVFLENRAGQLSEITELLYQHKVDLRAINIAETADYGVLRMITDNEEKTCSVLENAGFVCSVSEVFVVGVPDRPGGLSELVRYFAEENIDIAYMYSIFGQQNGRAYMVFRVDEKDKVRGLLAEHNIEIADTDILCANKK